MDPVRFIVWSDYLCPWCYNASRRLRRLEAEYAGRIELLWRSYLLRPDPAPRTPERRAKFTAYTRGWARVGAEDDAAEFRTWSSDEGPPTHSVPAHLVAKAALGLGAEAFQRMHDRLLRAYFFESRDISDARVLEELWGDAGLAPERFGESRSPELLERVLHEYRGAFEVGVTGVPAVQLEGNDAVIVGAHPEGLYRTWIERSLARRAERGAGG
ncbi:MAG: DsbA family oxidoreductase [Myxococcota bacterium]